MNEIIQAISTVGFPIVAYGGMFWYMVKLNDNHKEEIAIMKEALDQNTLALVKLKDLIENENKWYKYIYGLRAGFNGVIKLSRYWNQ